MDASLRTLELMASEVGATVIVLKEIVLNGLASQQPTASIETITDPIWMRTVNREEGTVYRTHMEREGEARGRRRRKRRRNRKWS